ncbi:MAG: helix-turn-helix transcriptional regulator [Clostridia bacterium]|nr:helix-turn-helix transcriptional regulator [Clostridia bacterium]
MTDEDIRRVARKEKERQGLSYEELEWRSGVARTTLCNFVSGQTKSITLGTAIKLLEGLGIEIRLRRKQP